jgi:hypothetical protein
MLVSSLTFSILTEKISEECGIRVADWSECFLKRKLTVGLLMTSEILLKRTN